ncbi:MAG: RIP metalloprotease RseP [Pseudomonadota bacterium]|nr:RIP metalloprotease RseP [Pseudomonadota bacterium]
MVDLIATLGSFLLVITIIVVVHEGGHFGAARICGVKVLSFSIGFGKKLLSIRRGETVFSLSAIPLGGYVQMLEMKEKSEDDKLEECFESKSLFAKSFIIAAGPLANFILAGLVYWIVFLLGSIGPIPYIGNISNDSIAHRSGFNSGDQILKINTRQVETWEAVHRGLIIELLTNKPIDFFVQKSDGSQKKYRVLPDQFNLNLLEEKGPLTQIGLTPKPINLPTTISKVVKNSPAYEGGLVAGDKIISIESTFVEGWNDIVEVIRLSPGKPLLFVVERGDQMFETSITPEIILKGEQKFGRLGIQADYTSTYSIQRYGVLEALGLALTQTIDMTLLTFRSLVKLVTLELSLKNLSGPITIADYAGKSMESGLNSFLSFLALISISIGIINLLPIPMLDGGHLLYNLIEFLRGKKLSDGFYETSQKIGLAVLLSLFFVAIYNDIFRIVN